MFATRKGQMSLENAIYLIFFYIIYFMMLYMLNLFKAIDFIATTLTTVPPETIYLWNFIIYIGVPLLALVMMVWYSKQKSPYSV